jgi:hypothetical protein
MSITITSFYSTSTGAPATGLTPTIRIWEVTGSISDLLIGAPNGSVINTDGTMTEVVDPPNSPDGFYKYEFLAYDQTKQYLVRTDSGPALPLSRRYQVVNIDPVNALTVGNIADAVWDEQLNTHLSVGSTGLALSQIKADTTNIITVNIPNLLNILNTLLKFETNRTKIDPVAHTLTVYDSDCTTPLHVFNLRDSTGTPSVTEVCERSPVGCP